MAGFSLFHSCYSSLQIDYNFLAICGQLLAQWKTQSFKVFNVSYHLEYMGPYRASLCHSALKLCFRDIESLMPCLLLVEPLKVHDHVKYIHVLMLLLKLNVHGGKHETSDVQSIILMLLVSISVNPCGISSWWVRNGLF